MLVEFRQSKIFCCDILDPKKTKNRADIRNSILYVNWLFHLNFKSKFQILTFQSILNKS